MNERAVATSTKVVTIITARQDTSVYIHYYKKSEGGLNIISGRGCFVVPGLGQGACDAIGARSY